MFKVSNTVEMSTLNFVCGDEAFLGVLKTAKSSKTVVLHLFCPKHNLKSGSKFSLKSLYNKDNSIKTSYEDCNMALFLM